MLSEVVDSFLGERRFLEPFPTMKLNSIKSGLQKSMKLLRIVLAIVLPPVAVFLTYGLGIPFWINLGLTILGWVPGAIHALWVVVKAYENPAYDADRRGAY